jgi:hypothetical protein
LKLKIETSNLSPAEISGLITLLETLLSDMDEPSSERPSWTRAPVPTPQEVPEDPQPSNPTPVTEAPAEPPTATALESPATPRKRHAKQVNGSAIKPIDADTLRSLLNAHIAKHSMEEAIAILQSFGCNRVTEALALEPAKLAELAGKLDV